MRGWSECTPNGNYPPMIDANPRRRPTIRPVADGAPHKAPRDWPNRAGTAKSFQAHPNQIVEQFSSFDFIFFRWVAAEIGERREREECNSFCISLARNSDPRSKVDWRAFVKLRPGQTRDARAF